MPANSVQLEWTAPGDDGNSGRATRYEIRYSTTFLPPSADSVTIASWWSGATPVPVPDVPIPSPAGGRDVATVQGLAYGSTYYFVLRTADEVPNWSPYSNVASMTLPVCDAPSAAPQSFQVRQDSLEVVLEWASTADPRATSFQIYRGSGSSGPLTLYATASAGDVSYRDAGVSMGATYRYAVAWAAACGNGPLTVPVAITLSAPGSGGGAAALEHDVHAYPNPADGPVNFVLRIRGASPQQASVRLYDMTGRWIADLAQGTYTPGDHTVTWPRTTRSGQRAAPGYYEVLGSIGATRVRERLVLLP